MYNRYLNAEGFDEYFTPVEEETPPAEPIPTEPEPEPAAPAAHKKSGILGSLGNLGDRIKLPELDSDTILLLVLVYFLVTDKDDKENNNIVDTLLIIGALLLLGF